MDRIVIRQATRTDLPLLRQFEQGVIAAERPFDPTLKPGQIHYYDLDTLLTEPNILLLLAEADGVAVGCGYARIETAKPYLQHQQHGYLGFMYVQPDHRGKGINQKIIAALAHWLQAKGVHEMRLDVYHQNTNALRAYEKAGFAPLMVEMRASLPLAETTLPPTDGRSNEKFPR